MSDRDASCWPVLRPGQPIGIFVCVYGTAAQAIGLDLHVTSPSTPSVSVGTRKTPSALFGMAAIFAAVGALLVPGVAIFAFSIGEWADGVVLCGIGLVAGWGVYALWDTFTNGKSSLGGRVGLVGLLVQLIGQIGLVANDDHSLLVSVLWLIGTALILVGLEQVRRNSP